MFRQLLSLATVTWLGIMSAPAADVTVRLTPDPAGEVTNLATVKFTFDGLEMINQQKIDKISATLTNETTGDRYVAVKVQYSYSEWNAATLSFGVEGSSTAASEITQDGTYKLEVAAGSFKSDIATPAYSSPTITETYTIGGAPEDEMSFYTLTPAPGEVSQINTIKIDFPKTGWGGIKIVSTDGITLTYTSHNGVTTRTAKVVKTTYTYGSDCGLQFDWEDATVKEPLTFITPGIYTLDIPEGAFGYFMGDAVNRHISMNYTIPQNGGALSTPSVQPAPGEVTEIKTVTLNFGNAANSLQFAEDLSPITITRKGDLKTTWHCIGVTSTQSTATFSFARENSDQESTINAPGEYLLTIPAGMISGYTSGGRKSNDGLQYLYTISQGVNNLTTWTLSPETETVDEIGRILLSFPDVQDNILLPADYSGISLAFTPYGATEVAETYHPRGSQHEGKTVTLIFGEANNVPFTAPGTYALSIPEDIFHEDGNSASSNSLIEKTYRILPVEATGITLDADTKEVLIGESFRLTATVSPDNTTDKTVTWTTSDELIATVDNDGNVTAVAVGNATVTATCGQVSASCEITVMPVIATGISVTPAEISAVEGDQIQLTATVIPDNTTDKTVIWTSSDEIVATVDATGLVSILKAGECEITATCGTATAICSVKAVSGIAGIGADTSGCIIAATSDCLTVTGIEGTYILRIYGADGTCRAFHKLNGPASVSIAGLNAGVYIARIAGVPVLRFVR